jgi:hypothetical protein
VRELAIAALQLQPDITVLFAGNNWNRFKPLPAELPEIDEALLKEGIAGVKRIREIQIERNSRRLVHDIATAYESSGVPFLWIIPEFNLGDWQDSNYECTTSGQRLKPGMAQLVRRSADEFCAMEILSTPENLPTE